MILFFTDPQGADRRITMQSSPVVSLRRVYDGVPAGDLGRYIVSTSNTDYDLQIPREKAHHLARELNLSFS